MRKFNSFVVAAFAAMGVALPLSSSAQATTYDATADFSIASNPNGVWSYGYLDLTGSTFTPYASSTATWHSPSATGPIDAWSQFTYDSNSYSVVGKNSTGTTQMENPAGSIQLDPGTLFAHPGNSGEKGTFRFTAPANGTADISAVFKATDTLGGNRDVHVYVAGVDQIPGSFVIGSKTTATPVSYSTSGVPVVAGEKIDFSVGYGSDATYSNDATFLSATVNLTPVPEPTSLVLFCLGAVGLFVAARRRRSA